jgi:hypothetical protein
MEPHKTWTFHQWRRQIKPKCISLDNVKALRELIRQYFKVALKEMLPPSTHSPYTHLISKFWTT